MNYHENETHFLATGIFLAAASTGLGQSTLQFTASTCIVVESAAAVALVVQRVNFTDTVVSVDYATADGTATNGLKYTAVAGTLTFLAGETNLTIAVPILNDGLVGGTTTFQGDPEQSHQCRPGHAHERHGVHPR